MDETAPIAKRATPVEDVLARAREFVRGAQPERAVEKALVRAGSFLALVHGEEEIDKSLWGSPAGKKHLAKRIVAAIPRHRVYVEPFAGGAQVFWAKEPSEVEVLADRDPEIAFAFRFVKNLNADRLARLKRRSWTGDPERFRKLYESEPEDDVERFYRFAYLALFSFNKLRRGTMPDKNVGVESRFCDRLEKLAPRLKDVVVRCADYEDVVDEFDTADAFFFLDPPYPGYAAEVGHDDWDEGRFGKVLRRVDGNFLVTYGTRSDGADALFKGFHVARWRHTSGVGAHQGQGLGKSVTLVATNYRIKKDAEPEGARQLALPSVAPAEPIDKTIWGSPAGKKRLAARLVKLVPSHRVYVEPFAGSAAVFFEKEPAEVEGDYVIAYTDSARARRALRKVGRPFKMRFLEARHAGLWKTRSRLFVASCKLKKIDDVEWLDDDVIDVDKQREVDFTLSWQFWKGQTVVRAAPSRQVWHLVLDRPGAGLDTWVLQADPLSGEERITALHTPRGSKDLLAFDGDVEPGQRVGGEVLNDTKATPSIVRVQDRGRAVLLDDQPTFKKVRFEGGKLRGVFTLTAEEAGSDIWQLARGQDPGRAIPASKADVPMRDGVQIWDPARKDPDVDRAELRPLAIFQPMKPAPRATNEFRDVDAALAWATAEMLEGGVAVEPKFNGFRVVLEKAGDKVLVFTEDTKRNISAALPATSAELLSLPGDFILDGEFFDFNEAGDPVPRRELDRLGVHRVD